jgi:hypothetical protein
MRKNKRGQIKSVILLFVIVLVVGLTIVLGRYILTNFHTAFEDTVSGGTTNGTNALAALTAVETQYNTFDYAMVFIVVCMIIGLMVTSFMIPTHPIFAVLNLLGIFILVFVGMVMTNVYGTIVAGDDATLTATAGDFVMTNYLLSYLPYIGAIVILITSIIMFVRGSTQG